MCECVDSVSIGAYLSNMRPMNTILLAMFVLSYGCSEEAEERIQVNLCGDLVVPAEIDAIRLTVYNEDRSLSWWGLNELTDDTLVQMLDLGIDAEVIELPDAGMPDGDVTAMDGAAEDSEVEAEVPAEVDAGSAMADIGHPKTMLERRMIP